MSHHHLTRELLRAVARGEQPVRQLAEAALDHLSALCPTCRRELRAFGARRAGGGAPYERLLGGGAEPEPETVLARGEEQARRDLATLLALVPEERWQRVQRARNRFRGAALARLLLAEGERRLPAAPGETLRLAELARLVLHRSATEPGTFDLLALAGAQMANACRASGDLQKAEEHFGHVHYVVAREGVAGQGVRARLADLEGSLRKDQRRFAEAEELFSRAAALYRGCGDASGSARVLLKLGDLYYLQSRFDAALATARAALHRVPAESSPRLHLCGRHNIALYLAESGRPAEAAAALEQDEALYRRFPDAWTQLRLSWLRGKIAAALGDAGAEEALRAARDGFLAEGIGYDAAMVGLDLALLFLREGRTADLKAAAEEMLPVFQAQDVHREAAAALALFQEAARREELTCRLAGELLRYLREARRDPSLRFERPAA